MVIEAAGSLGMQVFMQNTRKKEGSIDEWRLELLALWVTLK